MRWIVGVALLIGPACISTRTVGMTDLELAAPAATPIVCLDAERGSTGQLVHGTIAGRPAVHAAFGLGARYTLDQRVEVPGGAAYGGEECVHDGALCDHVLVVELADESFVLFRQSFSDGPVPAAASSQAIVEQATRDGVLAQLAALELDAPTRIAFAALADARETASWIKLAGVAASAGVLTAGAYTGDQAMMNAGRDAGLDISRLKLTDAERPLVAQYPQLARVLSLGRTVCIEGKPPS